MNKTIRIRGALDSLLIKIFWYSLCLAGVVLGLLSSGCTTTEMKGTPFYTGESSKRRGAAEQRVNVWPVLYYRAPDLSVLWPVFELTEDHAAVRPLYSVYGLDETNHQYNVLWPLAQFDRRTDDSRIFPLFWGEDYRVLFPLYWHEGQPWGDGGGSDTLFPLWHLSRKGTERFNLYSPWPLVHVWSDQKAKANGSMVVPLYWHKRTDRVARFYSPLWLSEEQRDGDYWRMLFPLYYDMVEGDAAAFVSLLWAQGHSGTDEWRGMLPFWMYCSDGDEQFDLSCPWPLVRFWSDPQNEDQGSRILPLYWYNQKAGGSQFFSLPWSCGSDQSGRWRFLLPLYYQSSNSRQASLITPLWSQGRIGETDWDMLFPLWFRSHDGTNRFSLYAPLAHFWSDARADDHGSTVVPLYWHQKRQGSSQFTSLLWFNHSEPNGDFWRLLPPIFYQESDRNGSMLVTPLWAQGKSETNDWGAIIPFCYWDQSQHTLLSPLWAHWREADAETWLVPWTLSWQTSRPERSDFTLLGGVAHASWGLKPGPDYIFPLYYNDSEQGTQLSPLWFRWRDKERETTVAPWLLSWRTRETQHTDLWLAGGLACSSWGAKPGADYVFPIFYHDAERLLTPLFGWDDHHNYCYLATPLAGVRTGAHRGSWLFPLYSHSRVEATGKVKDNFLLLGGHTKTEQQSHSWFIPLFSYRNQPLPDGPIERGKRYQTYGQSFWCLPICWYRDQTYLRPGARAAARADAETNPDSVADGEPAAPLSRTNAPLVRDDTLSHGVFPLWNYSAHATPAEGRSNRDASVLLWLYDSKRELGPLPGVRAGVTNDYTRTRVLWRLWHYEKLNGEVSVDVFPSFTYDRKLDGFKKISFLWRFFRYEHGTDGQAKLDVLFLPLRR